jgi:hypothetical protein
MSGLSDATAIDLVAQKSAPVVCYLRAWIEGDVVKTARSVLQHNVIMKSATGNPRCSIPSYSSPSVELAAIQSSTMRRRDSHRGQRRRADCYRRRN